MAFQSDFSKLRTWDPEIGWELFKIPVGPDFPHFELRHPERPPLQFWCKLLSREQIPGANRLGHPLYREQVAVHVMSPIHPDAGDKRLIQDAFEAFGY